jgi:hypothetical protein
MLEMLYSLMVELRGAVDAEHHAALAGFLGALFSGLTLDLTDGLGPFLSQLGDGSACSRQDCPGSGYNSITVSWANIGYMTHADFLHFVNNDSFGYWAAILYLCGAIGALVSVALNSPPRNWVWFLIGPGIFQFLIATTEPVKGVSWRIAGKDQNMEKVWRDAETGLANTELVNRLNITVSRKAAPSQPYPVAWMLVFLDGLFSETSDKLISWIGMQRRKGTGGPETNLFQNDSEEGPWYLLANLKWGMIENIGGVTVRDPDVRDALVTFLTSECGDQFKRGINSGAYASASQSRGKTQAASVLHYEPNYSGNMWADVVNNSAAYGQALLKFARGLDTEIVPTPRSVVRLLNSPKDLTGTFRKFSTVFSADEASNSGRTSEIVCSEYLYTIIQALRWEAGHSYWQLLRSFPEGFDSPQMALETLFYGWNLRRQENGSLIQGETLEKFTKYLVFLHLLRNELMLAPQVTETQQRFTASEQTRNFTESFVRSQGSRSKYGELYNWAVMMPHVQGIITYVILIGYPFAVMLMVIPGYWKAFFTWITFFAWVKLWDVGFAMVHTLERSVWATLGNRSSIASISNRLIQIAESGDYDITTNCPSGGSGATGTDIAPCPVPDVKEGQALQMSKAWILLDQALLLSGAVDLDLVNGYYIYIMSALYFAVPAVTGQLVLGAKSGMSSLATQAISQSAGEAGGAAKSGAVGELTNRMASNKEAIGQAAMAKSDRRTGLALEQLQMANRGADQDIETSRLGALNSGVGAGVDALEARKTSYDKQRGLLNSYAQGLAQASKIPGLSPPTSKGVSEAGGAAGGFLQAIGQGLVWGGNTLGQVGNIGMEYAGNEMSQGNLRALAQAKALGADINWATSRARLRGQGYGAHAQRLERARDFERESAGFDELARWAADTAGTGGVVGVNPGSMIGSKPKDSMGMAMSGQLGGETRGAARYMNEGFKWAAQDSMRLGMSAKGGQWVLQNWGGGFEFSGAFMRGVGSIPAAVTLGAWTHKESTSNTGAVAQSLQGGLQSGAIAKEHATDINAAIESAAPAEQPTSATSTQAPVNSQQSDSVERKR